jgi:hypothetical protein
MVLLAMPPDDTISEPPLLTVVPTAVPPDKMLRVPPLRVRFGRQQIRCAG